MKEYPKGQTDSKPQTEIIEGVRIVRSAHAQPDRTSITVASFIIASDGARLLTGHTVTKRAAHALTRNAEAHERATSNVRSFPPRPTSPANKDRRVAA